MLSDPTATDLPEAADAVLALLIAINDVVGDEVPDDEPDVLRARGIAT